MEFNDCIYVSATAKILSDTTGAIQAANIVLKCVRGRDLAEKDIHKKASQIPKDKFQTCLQVPRREGGLTQSRKGAVSCHEF